MSAPPPRPPPPYGVEEANNEALPSYAPQNAGAVLPAPPTSSMSSPNPSLASSATGPGPMTVAIPNVMGPPATVVPPSEKEHAFVSNALASTLPALQQRLNECLSRGCPLQIDVNRILGPCTSAQNRQSLAEELLKEKSGCLATLVHTIEKAAMDGSVKADIAMQVQRVEVLPADASGVTFAQGAIMIFVRPNTRHGCPGKTAMQQMLEISFFAEERRLMNLLFTHAIPEHTRRLSETLGHPTNITVDATAILNSLPQEKRLETARLMATDTGFKRGMRQLNEGMDKILGSVLDKPKTTTDPKMAEIRSQHFAAPVVRALERLKRVHPENLVLQAVQEVRLTSTSEEKRMLVLDSANQQIVDRQVLHTQNQPRSLVLVVEHQLLNGLAGTFSDDEAMAHAEVWTQAQERNLINYFVGTALINTQAQLCELLGRPVGIDVDWNTVFPQGGDPFKRAERARTLAENGGKNTSLALQNAMAEVIAQSNAQATFAVIGEIQIQHDEHGPALSNVAGKAGQKILYKVNLDQGLSGVYDHHQLKQALRAMFGIPTPANEKGFSGGIKSVAASVDRWGDKFARSFNVFGKK
ncbi:uncharacterized protein MONBRDRAFT_37502 [Monosiga brevicollis MX1]|uniref:Uncharacterized protein n=1 Tax=Monosiga brevicollis TaxID=81824 RepID=A9V246_MONBE|nr:uncharacterized protein MONBRDRAFT_37502 [Monosiga brevicollis MX1]EDQ88317.1 predicted protein [Monosiga brevicollis MX1]|eukprot:XP_001746910.1 hypothetical protein [Monosiga brevicollis MX1]